MSKFNKPEISARRFLTGIFTDNPATPDDVLDELDYYSDDQKLEFVMNLYPLLNILRILIFTSKNEKCLEAFCHFCQNFKSLHEHCNCSKQDEHEEKTHGGTT